MYTISGKNVSKKDYYKITIFKGGAAYFLDFYQILIYGGKNMLKGVDENGNLQNVFVSEEGALKVNLEGAVATEQTSDNEITILSEVLTVGTTATSKTINKKVTSIMVANYSETSDVSIVVGENTLQVGANLALELPINEQISNLSITAPEDSTKIQLVVKGVE